MCELLLCSKLTYESKPGSKQVKQYHIKNQGTASNCTNQYLKHDNFVDNSNNSSLFEGTKISIKMYQF